MQMAENCVNIMESIEFITLEELSQRFPIEDVKTQYLSLLSFLSETPMISNDAFKHQLTKITRLGVIWVCIKNDQKNDQKTWIYPS